MALSVDPATFVISIPKADLTLIQSNPTEIRELNLNEFRLNLKAWEAGGDGLDEGITFLKTHVHNTEVSLGGLTFARTIEVLDPYSVTFEDGQYAVNLVGANSNVGDKVNVNQVSVRSQNSAGLISSPDIEFASFNGGVTIDTINGFSGTIFPTGTERKKSNNISDALLIADYRGLRKIYLHSDITLGSDADMDEFIIVGLSHVETQVTIDADANVHGVTIRDCEITGTLDGDTVLEYCVVSDITYLNGHVHNCSLIGTIVLGGGNDAYINNCTQLDMNTIPVVDMGGSGQDLVMPNYEGIIRIENLTGANKIGIGLVAGEIILNSATVTSGAIQVGGIGYLRDESGNNIASGTWNGVTIINGLVSNENIAKATTNEIIPFIYGK